MLIRFTRLTNDRHRFEIVRDDETHEAHDLETRSVLPHDLAHYAVELESNLRNSFYGRLARGIAYADLVTIPPDTPEAMETERVVAMLQGAFKTLDAAAPDFQRVLSRFAAYFEGPNGDGGRPRWLTAEVMPRIVERLRRVDGQWRATRFHETMELRFPRGRGD